MKKWNKIVSCMLVVTMAMIPLMDKIGGTAYADFRNIMVTIAGTGGTGLGNAGDGGPATAAALHSPSGIAVNSNGDVFFTDSIHYTIRKINATTGIITTVAGNGFAGYSGDGGAATTAQLGIPYGIALDSKDNLYIADMNNHRIRKVDAKTGIITTVAGNGSYGYSGDGGDALSAQLNEPLDVAIDSKGNVYIADSANQSIRKVDPEGKITTVAGNGPEYWFPSNDGDGGPATNAEFDYPSGLAIDSIGNLYIADTGHSTIRKVDFTTGEITRVAGNRTPGYSGDGGAATSASLQYPRGIRLDNNDNLYIADRLNATIRKVDKLTGNISTVAGTGTLGYSGDLGPATSAQLNYPYAVAVDNNGNVYIADTSNNRIRRVGPSNDASLSGLTLSSDGLNPNFNPETTSYTAIVPPEAGSITITPTVRDSMATVTVNGAPVPSGTASDPISLALGDTVTIVVTAEDHSMKTYTVTKAPSNDPSLKGLTLSSGTLSPTFFRGTMSYTANVATSVSSLTVTPTVNDSTATVTVNGTSVPNGTTSDPIGLNMGSNTITVVVTAENGRTFTYTVTVARGNQDADLSGLSLSDGTLSPTFTAGTTSYTANVANSVSSLAITPTVSDSAATVTVNGLSVPSGTTSNPIGLNMGSNPITVVVTAENGATKTYTVTVARGNQDADLSGLSLSSGTLSPTFTAGTTSYTANVANSVSSLAITPTVSDSAATVTVNGLSVPSGTTSNPIGLNMGSNSITVVVTAENGTTKTYTVTVTRGNQDADLSGLSLSSGTLSPTFTAGTTSYTANVANSVSSLTITPTVNDSNAVVQVNGTPVASGMSSGAIDLHTGSNNLITVNVTANDGVTTKTYTVTVTRDAASDADLSGLSLSSGTLSPTFTAGTTSYTANVANSVSSLTITPTVSDNNAVVQVNGEPVASGAPSGAINLHTGSTNLITIGVTADDAVTTKTYTVTVTRAEANAGNDNGGGNSNGNNGGSSGTGISGGNSTGNTDMNEKPSPVLSSLILSTGDLTPSFSPGTKTYKTKVGNSVSSMTFTLTLSDSNAKIRINDMPVTNASPSSVIPLNVGENKFTFTVTGQNGTISTYTVIVTREAASSAANGSDSSEASESHGPVLNHEMINVGRVKEALETALQLPAPERFTDVSQSNWSSSGIEVARQIGMIEGRMDGRFDGSAPVTRAEFIMMVAKSLKLDMTQMRNTSFHDTRNHWAEKAITALEAAGVIHGSGEQKFRPNQPITRAEMAAVLARLLVWEEPSADHRFTDTQGSWARSVIDHMAEAGIIRGTGNDRFSPDASATREQAIMMILRMLTVCRNVEVSLIDLTK
ncbi:cadherin-like beta sandwich domain-containing protein [Paenibacillus silvae]|uniref:cadherin-like beta sandwich domain-containing protein n=1 Tax=Paenibacillus silvae TaxID=1325358 RepID=UPI00142D53FB|nr:cadherin-like beta sandwich domain-containing protein [Paenibacillus silvae]